MSAKILFLYLFLGTNLIFSQAHLVYVKNSEFIDFTILPTGNENVLPIDEAKENEMIDLINELRISHGLHALIKEVDLVRAARYHAADMAMEGYFKHHTLNRGKAGLKDELGTFDRIRLFYRNKGFANSENIALGRMDPKGAFSQWVNSSRHLENMLNENSTHIGIGFYQKNDSEWGGYWVMDTAID